MANTVFATLIVYSILLYESGLCDRVHHKIYYDVPAIRQCFRRLNATHQIGCASDQRGNVGVLHYVSGEEDLNWLIDNGPHQPYIVLLTQQTFTGNVTNRLRESGKVNGVLTIHNTSDIPAHFSPDSSCPNSNFELYKGDRKYEQCKSTLWNPVGNDLLMTDIGFPIITLVDEEQINFLIYECYEKFNKPLNGSVPRSYPLCGAEIKAGMDAVKDTPTCINRGKTRNLNPQQFCDPIGDSNVYGFLHPIPYERKADFNDTLENGSVIIAAAKLDAAGLFQYIVPGAHSTVSGFITLLAAAQALGRVKDSIDPANDKHIMFAFFQGESFDYIGSTRMLYDMEQGLFPYKLHENSKGIHPIHPNHIGYFIEIGQVSALSGLYVHSDPRSNNNETVKSLVSKMETLLAEYGNNVNISIRPTSKAVPLPPASLQTFLKKVNIPGVVLTDYEHQFQNQFFNSHLDIPSNINYTQTTNDSQTEVTALAKQLADIATVVAHTLYNLSTGHQYNDDNKELVADSSMVAQMLYCFFLTPRCDLFNMTLNEKSAKNLQQAPYSFYVGVERDPSPVTLHTKLILSYFTGNEVNLTADDCKNYNEKDKDRKEPRSPYYNYVWMQGPVNKSSPTEERIGICIETTVNTSAAVSPAFLDGNDLASTEYPAWSESIWSAGVPAVRVFLIPDRTYEVTTLCVGIAVLVISLPAVFLFNRRAKILFLAK